MSKLRGILKDPEIDAVFVLLPHNLHEQVCFEATQAGKHVPAGKPIACTLEEADNMIQARQKAGVTLMVAYDQRFEPVHKRIREPLDQNAIGERMCNWGVIDRSIDRMMFVFGNVVVF